MNKIHLFFVAFIVLVLSGCAAQKPGFDYTAFKNSRPKSILVLPPINSSVDVNATYSFYSNISKPLGEAGYYVFPVAIVDGMFKENGFTSSNDIHTIPNSKLYDIFKADTALYLNIKDYGTRYAVLSSAAVVTVEATLIDLRSGARIWSGKATASSEEGKNNNQGIAGLMVSALVNQIVGSLSDQSHQVGKITAERLLTSGQKNGILYGPRSINYMTEK
jgi:hypothetical protein